MKTESYIDVTSVPRLQLPFRLRRSPTCKEKKNKTGET